MTKLHFSVILVLDEKMSLSFSDKAALLNTELSREEQKDAIQRQRGVIGTMAGVRKPSHGFQVSGWKRGGMERKQGQTVYGVRVGELRG